MLVVILLFLLLVLPYFPVVQLPAVSQILLPARDGRSNNPAPCRNRAGAKTIPRLLIPRPQLRFANADV